MHQLSSKIDAEINIEDMVSRKVEAFSSSKLENSLPINEKGIQNYRDSRCNFRIFDWLPSTRLVSLGLNPVVVPFIMILQSLQNIQIKIL